MVLPFTGCATLGTWTTPSESWVPHPHPVKPASLAYQRMVRCGMFSLHGWCSDLWVLLFDSCYQDYICSLIIAPRWGPQLSPPSTCAVLGRSQGCWSGGGGELAVGPWAGRGELPVPQAQGPQLTEVAGATWLSPGPRPVSGLCSHSLSGEFEPRPGGPHCSSLPLSGTEGRPSYLARVSRETVGVTSWACAGSPFALPLCSPTLHP